MKNSKPFPCPDWLGSEFLSPPEARACRALFLTQGAELSLTVIDLARLQAELTTVGRELTATYLDRSEVEQVAAFGFAKRRLEWLGGRIAAKHAAHAILAKGSGPPPCFPELLVANDPAGRPHLRDQRGNRAELAASGRGTAVTLPAISISHSHGYAGALAVTGSHSCGLDLQRVTPQVLRVRDRFATQEEVALLHAAPSLAGQEEALLLTLLWSAKESLRKAIACAPLLGFTEMTLTRLEVDPEAGMRGHFACPRPAIPLAPVFLALRDHLACAITVQASLSPTNHGQPRAGPRAK